VVTLDQTRPIANCARGATVHLNVISCLWEQRLTCAYQREILRRQWKTSPHIDIGSTTDKCIMYKVKAVSSPPLSVQMDDTVPSFLTKSTSLHSLLSNSIEAQV
jgi:hypothetical protein